MNGNVALTIDKLPGIHRDLVCNDENWQSWDFLQLCAALKSWTHRNSLESNSVESPCLPILDGQFLQAFNTWQQGVKPHVCMYCEETSHKSADCPCMSTLDGRKKILAKKTTCFNYTGPRHQAAKCVSKMSCELCSRKHHVTLQFVMISVLTGRVLRLLLAMATIRLVELNVVPS